MKKCPYCAEEIRDEAVFCRYCVRRVKGRHNRLIFCAMIAAVIACLYLANKPYTDFRIAQLTSRFRSICCSVEAIIRESAEGIKAMKERNSFMSTAGVNSDIPKNQNE